MAKDPAFLFYPNDWLGGTLGMSYEEKGAYMEVLMMQFSVGHMTEDMIGRMIGQLWGRIKHKFSLDTEGRYYNERLEAEQLKRKSYVQSRFNNKTGNNQYPKKNGHMTLHMGNGNGNKKGVVGENKGKEFDEDNSGVFFPDGSYQPLGELQREAVLDGKLKPHAIIKGAIY